MKKYKIGNRIITADSPVEAIKVSKMLDSATKEIEYLTKEEEQAVEDYRNAIAGTTNPKLLELYKHILDEELEHIKELQEADVEDCDMKDVDIISNVKFHSTGSHVRFIEVYKGHAISYNGNTNSSLNQRGYYQVHKRNGFMYKTAPTLEKARQEIELMSDSVKDYAPPYAIWVKKGGKWIIFGGATSTNIDKRRFLNSGYEDVTVVENGKEPTQDCDMKDSRKAEIYVYPRSSRDKQDILRLCSNLNTKCKILRETSDQMKIEIDGDVFSVVDDLKSLGLMRRADKPIYTDSKDSVSKSEIEKVESIGVKHTRDLGEDVHEFDIIKKISNEDVKKVIPANASFNIRGNRLVVNF